MASGDTWYHWEKFIFIKPALAIHPRKLSVSVIVATRWSNITMVYCVVVGCKNGTNKDNPFTGSFHRFPSEQRLRRVWLARIFRANYRWKPHYQICSDHFHPDDFIISHQRAQDLGVNPGRFQLKPSVNPSLLLRPSSTTTDGTATTDSDKVKKTPRRGAAEKREKLRVSVV